MLRRGDMAYFPEVITERNVATRAEIEGACFKAGRIDQEPTKPEPWLTPSEEALINRQNCGGGACG